MPTLASPLTLIFPMAGQSAHEGFKFKPFLTLDKETLIEAAVRPFEKWKSSVRRLVFVVLEEHDRDYGVAARLHELFSMWPHDVIVLAHPTEGPAMTLAEAVARGRIAGPAIVCDCDHSLNVDPLFGRIAEGAGIECGFPTWSLRGENLRAWSVAACGPNGQVAAIAEKQLPAAKGDFVGVVGCYYFAHVEAIAEIVCQRRFAYLSTAIQELIAAGSKVIGVPIARAEFFGDTRGLLQARARRDQFVGSIFCDLDGTVIEHEASPRYDQPLVILPGSREKLAEWVDAGYLVVLTTARPPSDQAPLEQSLREAGVAYHRLILGLPSGPRYSINDRKPSAILVPQTVAYEVSRNEGIQHIVIPSMTPTVLKRFHGASLADTVLVEDDEKLFVRKRVLKRDQLTLGYAKLRNQYRTMERLAQYGNIVPALYGEHDNSLEYYYDMEYLPRHRPVSQLDSAELGEALGRLMTFLQDRIYAVKTSTSCMGEDWLLAHFARKIFPKLDGVQSYPALARLVNAERVCINGRSRPGLRALLSTASSSRVARSLAPRWLSAVHGDLTFENVLYHQGDFRVIDADGGDFLDAAELDMGKIFQSLVGRYEFWAHSDAPLCEFADDSNIVLKRDFPPPDPAVKDLCVRHWSQILHASEDQAYAKGLFYMALHLIRMIPFRLRVSEEQALYAMCMATEWMNTAFEQL
ncbi:MAG TPA: phosphotransferase [Pirellulales bacterium]|jgi:hypothetical protein|nr:phosphotransferase [Pirellulales bacterium]